MNPFTLVYDEIYKVSRENTILQKYIRDRNYVKLDQQAHQKENISSADLPELILTHTAITGNLVASSSSAEFVCTYNWLSTVGSWDLANLTAEILWGLATASAVCCPQLSLLQWKGQTFISFVQMAGAEITVVGESTRGIKGWSINWPILVTLRLPRSEVRNYQCQGL